MKFCEFSANFDHKGVVCRKNLWKVDQNSKQREPKSESWTKTNKQGFIEKRMLLQKEFTAVLCAANWLHKRMKGDFITGSCLSIIRVNLVVLLPAYY